MENKELKLTMIDERTGKEIEHPEEWMNPAEIADLMLYILNLPKMIEVSEITINRKNI